MKNIQVFAINLSRSTINLSRSMSGDTILSIFGVWSRAPPCLYMYDNTALRTCRSYCVLTGNIIDTPAIWAHTQKGQNCFTSRNYKVLVTVLVLCVNWFSFRGGFIISVCLKGHLNSRSLFTLWEKWFSMSNNWAFCFLLERNYYKTQKFVE